MIFDSNVSMAVENDDCVDGNIIRINTHTCTHTQQRVAELTAALALKVK